MFSQPLFEPWIAFSTSIRKEIEQFHIFLCMQNTRAIGEGKTLKINPEIRVLVHVDCLVRDGKPGSPAISNLLKSLCPPYRSIDLHLQFLSIFLQPLYQFGQWNSTVLLLVFILSCFGLTSEKWKEYQNQEEINHSSLTCCANWTTFVAFYCLIRVPGFLDSNSVQMRTQLIGLIGLNAAIIVISRITFQFT